MYLTVSDVLRGKPAALHTTTAEAGVRELLALLAEHNIGAAVVSADGAHVDGIVSERDVVRRLHHDGTVVNNVVGAIMTPGEQVATCAPEDDADRVLALMTEQRVRHVPVVADGVLVGLVSIGDLVKHKIERLEFERDQLDAYVRQA